MDNPRGGVLVLFVCSFFFAKIKLPKMTGSRGFLGGTLLDKYESNHTGDEQTDRQKRMEVRTVKIYDFVRSNVVTSTVTERQILVTWVSRNIGH